MPARSEAYQLSVTYPKWRLEPVSFTLDEGCSALIGTNGAGKTTLMRAMLGLQGASGWFSVGEFRSDMRADARAFRSAVGYLPQSVRFPRFVTARHVLAYAASLKGIRGPAVARSISDAADLADIGALLDRQAATLSGGQQRRLGLAVAAVHQPELLILDEPTAGLDPVQRQQFRDWLTTYCQGRSALVSTHLIEDIASNVVQLLVLNDGHLVFDGAPNDLAGSGSSPSSLEERVWQLLTAGRP